MSCKILIIHAHDFIKATPEGTLDLACSRKLLIDIATNSGALADHELLLDTRRAHSVLSVTDLYEIVGEIHDHQQAYSRRTAVLCPRERFEFAEFFALCAQNRGFSVNAFTSFEEAIDWLVENSSRPLT